jgi:hypothetical protein
MKTVLTPTKVFNAFGSTKDFLTGADVEKIKVLLENPAAKPDEFLALLPPENILAMMLASSGDIPPEIPEALRKESYLLKELIDQKLPGLQINDSFQRAVVVAFESLEKPPDNPADIHKTALKFKTISAVATSPFLFGVSEPLIPILRIVIQSNPAGSNFEFFAGAEELSSLARRFTENLAQMLEQRSPLASKGVAKIISPSEVREISGP